MYFVTLSHLVKHLKLACASVQGCPPLECKILVGGPALVTPPPAKCPAHGRP